MKVLFFFHLKSSLIVQNFWWLKEHHLIFFQFFNSIPWALCTIQVEFLRTVTKCYQVSWNYTHYFTSLNKTQKFWILQPVSSGKPKISISFSRQMWKRIFHMLEIENFSYRKSIRYAKKNIRQCLEQWCEPVTLAYAEKLSIIGFCLLRYCFAGSSVKYRAKRNRSIGYQVWLLQKGFIFMCCCLDPVTNSPMHSLAFLHNTRLTSLSLFKPYAIHRALIAVSIRNYSRWFLSWGNALPLFSVVFSTRFFLVTSSLYFWISLVSFAFILLKCIWTSACWQSLCADFHRQRIR